MRRQRVEEIDWLNVAEELEGWGKSARRSVESLLARIVEHFLKLTYAPNRKRALNRRAGELTIREAHHQVRKLLNESPSLRPKTAELFPDTYESGRNGAPIALTLRDSAIPEISPWRLEEILDDRFLPNADPLPSI